MDFGKEKNMNETNLYVKHPCVGCKYFKECGNSNRTQFCAGRDTHKEKTEKKGYYYGKKNRS